MKIIEFNMDDYYHAYRLDDDKLYFPNDRELMMFNNSFRPIINKGV